MACRRSPAAFWPARYSKGMKIMKYIFIIAIVCALFFSGTAMAEDVQQNEAPKETAAAEKLVEQMNDGLKNGDFTGAIKRGIEADKVLGDLGRVKEQADVLLSLSLAYNSLGHYRAAQKCLETALRLSKKTEPNDKEAVILAHIGNSYLLTNDLDKAAKVLEEAQRLAEETKNDAALAAVLNNTGNLLFLQKKYAEATGLYQRSYELAVRTGNNLLAARAMSNSARTSLARDDVRSAEASLRSAYARHMALPDSHDKAYGLIGIARMYTALASRSPNRKAELTKEARRALDGALKSAEPIKDHVSLSYASGYLGALSENEGDYDAAMRYTRQAIFEAQAAGALESLYRWYWQTARLMVRTGNAQEALLAYRKTINVLQSIRYEFSGDCRIYNQATYTDSAEPIYVEFVNLLLKEAASKRDEKQSETYLLEAIQAVELLRAAELQDYFQNSCVAAKRIKIDNADLVHPGRAIFYFITLPDRIEVIAGLPRGFRKYTVGLGRDTVAKEIRQFRRTLENRTSREYMVHGQKLYDWMVRPIEADLIAQKVDTIIFVPDGTLRTMPFAALHDGKDFLITRFAAVTMPGLTLVDASPRGREKDDVLIAGLSDGVQGFSPLPYVPYEVEEIRKLVRSTALMNKEFETSLINDEIRKTPFSIVHIASHGEFSENAAETYILTWNEKLNMDQLEKFVGMSRYRKNPVELLTLSACQSAATNDRAALGLAGLSVKAGARSALATLWYINDQASSDLVVEFYRNLTDRSFSKAKALRQAQLKLLKGERYQHPCYWAPFVLVGNWL